MIFAIYVTEERYGKTTDEARLLCYGPLLAPMNEVLNALRRDTERLERRNRFQLATFDTTSGDIPPIYLDLSRMFTG